MDLFMLEHSRVVALNDRASAPIARKSWDSMSVDRITICVLWAARDRVANQVGSV
jgi:hypothetical protein